MVEHKPQKKRSIATPKMLVIALCVLIYFPSTKGISVEFDDRSVDHWKFAFGANLKEFHYDFCKYNATSEGQQCTSFAQAPTDIREVCNCTVQHDETNEGSLFFELNCKSNLSHCPEKLSLTYEQGSYAKAPMPDPDVATREINGWLVEAFIISAAVNVLTLTNIIIYLKKKKYMTF